MKLNHINLKRSSRLFGTLFHRASSLFMWCFACTGGKAAGMPLP